MKMPGRIAAAIEILPPVLSGQRPAAIALQDWARHNRFAGSGDRAAIGNIVYDVLRRRASLSHLIAADTARALVLAVLHHHWDIPVEDLAALSAEQFGPGALTDEERHALENPRGDMPASAEADVPEWLFPQFAETFGDAAVAEGRALAGRAPVDVRVNTLKCTVDKAARALKRFEAVPGPLSPLCLRLPMPGHAGRHPNVEADPAHARGWFEVQDAASQVAALLAGARAGMQVADICAGAGGKTLALAATMTNKGQLHAWDADRHRFRPIIYRLKRAGVRNAQVIPSDEPARLDALAGKMDLVVIDAPCSGSGAWRRRPDTKWRLTEDLLAQRLADQRDVLTRGAPLVRPGGRLVYITCSVLTQENTAQVAWFLEQNPDFKAVPYEGLWRETIGTAAPVSADAQTDTLLLTPARHDTDGFFVAVLEKG
jgi:16S rRNA (cytosine967-C5)-methyltransferase